MKPGDIVAGRFRVIKRVGEGGMGSIYQAEDLQYPAKVALKVLLSPESAFAERFLLEAKTLALLDHPAIVAYVAHGLMQDHQPYLAMQWLEGTDLSKVLRKGPLSVAQTLLILRRIAAGLGSAHERGIVHRDLKPANIVLVDDQPSQATLVDFGVARPKGITRGLTRTGAIIGTVGYMSPEQLQATRAIDGRADLFALGCVAFECLTGRPAFVGDNIAAVLAAVLLGETPRVRTLNAQISPEIDAFVATLMHSDRDQRFASSSFVIDAIDALPTQLESVAPTLIARPTNGATLQLERTPIATVLLWDPSIDLSGDSDSIERARVQNIEAAQRLGAAVAERWGGVMKPLSDAVLLAFSQGSAISEQVARAARAALELYESLPHWNISLALSQMEASDVRSGRPLLSQFAHAEHTPLTTDAQRVSGVSLAASAEGLLSANFLIERSGPEAVLKGYSASLDESRKILGRVSPCVGREKELRLLEGTLDECLDERDPRMVVLIAPPGVGKSRLRREFLHRLDLRDDVVQALAKADVGSSQSAFALVRQWFESVHGPMHGTPEQQWKQLQDYASPMLTRGKASNVSQALEFLGELLGTPAPAPSGVLLDARTNAREMRQQFTSVFASWLRGVAMDRALLLVLEDAHWADSASVSVLLAAWETIADVALNVVVTSWPEIESQFPAVLSGKNTQVVKLEPLGKRASERVVRQLLGEDVSPQTVLRIVEMAAGNAFLLEEIVRHVGAKQKLEDLPTSAVALVQSRLQSLPSAARKVLRLASVFGESFSPEALPTMYAAHDSDTIDTQSALQKLRQEELLLTPSDQHEQSPLEQRWAFRHSLVQRAAYEMLTESDRKHAHIAAAEWIAKQTPDKASEVGAHYERAGAFAMMAEWYLKEVDSLHALGEYKLVGELATRCDQVGVPPMLRARALFSMLFALVFDGNFERIPAFAERLHSEDIDRNSAAWFNLQAGLLSLNMHGGLDIDVKAECDKLFALRCEVLPTTESVFTFCMLVVSLLHAGLTAEGSKLARLLEECPLDEHTQPGLVALRGAYVPCMLAAEDDPRGLQMYRSAVDLARKTAATPRFLELAAPYVWFCMEYGQEAEAKALLQEVRQRAANNPTVGSDWLLVGEGMIAAVGHAPSDLRGLFANEANPEWRHTHLGIQTSVHFARARANRDNPAVLRECASELAQIAATTGPMVQYRNLSYAMLAWCANTLGEHEQALRHTDQVDRVTGTLSLSGRTLHLLQRLVALRALGQRDQCAHELGLAQSRLRMIANGLAPQDRANFVAGPFVKETLEFALNQ